MPTEVIDKSQPHIPTSTLENTKNAFEIGGKLVFGSIAICYLMGLMVVNIYLNNFGVYSPTLFRLSYIAAGAWSLIPIALMLVAVILISGVLIQVPKIDSFFRKLSGEQKDMDRADSVFSLFIALALLAVVVIAALIVRKSIDNAGFTGSLFAGEVKATVASIVLYGVVLGPLLSYLLPSRISRFSTISLTVVMLGLVSFGHAYEFAKSVYGNIPASLGGGKPKEVQLVLDLSNNDREFLSNLGVTFQSDRSNITNNVSLLLATEEEYVLLISVKESDLNGKVRMVPKGLTIKNSKVEAVLYEGARFSGGSSGSY